MQAFCLRIRIDIRTSCTYRASGNDRLIRGDLVAYLSYLPRHGKVERLRKEMLLSQRELAERAHLSEATIIRVEAGKGMGRTTLQALADALDVAPLDLVVPA